MRTVQYKLGLPYEEETKKPNTTIIEPIENAISEIEEHLANINTETDYIQITPILPEKCTYKTYLDNGYLEISIAGKYAEKFTSIATNQDKAIARNARILDKAKCNALREHYKEQLKMDEQETTAEANQEASQEIKSETSQEAKAQDTQEVNQETKDQPSQEVKAEASQEANQ